MVTLTGGWVVLVYDITAQSSRVGSFTFVILHSELLQQTGCSKSPWREDLAIPRNRDVPRSFNSENLNQLFCGAHSGESPSFRWTRNLINTVIYLGICIFGRADGSIGGVSGRVFQAGWLAGGALLSSLLWWW